MREEAFFAIVHAQVELCIDVLEAKGKQYTVYGDTHRLEDRLGQFKIDLGDEVPPLESLAGQMRKHTTRLYIMLENPNKVTEAEWSETITDHINYLFLLSGLLKDLR